ncbi:MBL fold metallo-hydrolase [bacterium BFN5]|nr:MBL fold metallo-hydrolase [bacterium BFN5]
MVDVPHDCVNFTDMDAVLLTHIHRDHFDDQAAAILPKNLPVFCQPEDQVKLRELEFTDVIAITDRFEWQGIQLFRTGGQHGTGEIGQKMGPVSGYSLKASDEPCLYIAGDTIWCQPVAQALAAYNPDYIILFGGEARFNEGQPITMGKHDIEQVAIHAPLAQIAVVHMEAFNHCLLQRDELKNYLQTQGLQERVSVPDDGEWFIHACY